MTRTARLATGVTLPFVEQGDPAGVPLVLLHGAMDSWRAMEPVLAHLPSSIRAFAVTQRGHGDADRPESGYRIPDFASDLGAFLDAVGLGAAAIAGASSGGLVAQRFAVDHPDRTLGLILVGAPASLRGKPGVEDLAATVAGLTDPVAPAFVREFQHGTVARPVPEDLMQSVVRESLKVPARVWRATFAGLMEGDASDELWRIMAPTLVLWGDRDVFIQGDQDRFVREIPDCRLVVYEGGGHAFYWEEPERVAGDAAGFVAGLIG